MPDTAFQISESQAAPDRVANICDDLFTRGWSVQKDFLPQDLYFGLRQELLALDAAAELDAAGIGREDQFQIDRSIRKTRITWLDRTSPIQQAYFAWTNNLRRDLNRSLMLGLFEFESCYAIYPPGGFYDRHLDSLSGARNRMVSMVVYLNDQWDALDGGELDIWSEQSGEGEPPCATIAPIGRDVVFMLSETIPHAVRPTRVKRLGMAGWWRVNASGQDRVDPLF